MDPELLKKLNKRKQANDNDNNDAYVLQSPGASGGYLTSPSNIQLNSNNNNNSNASSSNDGENEILLDDITFPTPPLGKPSHSHLC